MNISNETCPPLEDIAAFLEGKLSGEERARIVAHLADCESCYAVFADAARFQLEEEKESARQTEVPAPVVTFPQKGFPRWVPIASIAALLLIGLATISIYWFFRGVPGAVFEVPKIAFAEIVAIYRSYNEVPIMVSAELVKPGLLGQEGLEERLWTEGDTRGGHESDAYSAAEFLVGVHLVDLRLTLARNDKASADALSRIYRHLKSFPFEPEETKFYRGSLEAIDNGKIQPKDLLEEATRMEASLTEVSSPYLSFGKWTEAGRLSTLAQDADFFQDRKNRRFLRMLLRNAEEESLDKRVIRALEQVQNLVKRSKPATLPFNALAAQFRTILEHFEAQALAGSDIQP